MENLREKRADAPGFHRRPGPHPSPAGFPPDGGNNRRNRKRPAARKRRRPAIGFFYLNPGRFEIDGTNFEIAGIAHSAAAVLGASPVLITLGRLNRPEKA